MKWRTHSSKSAIVQWSPKDGRDSICFFVEPGAHKNTVLLVSSLLSGLKNVSKIFVVFSFKGLNQSVQVTLHFALESNLTSVPEMV